MKDYLRKLAAAFVLLASVTGAATSHPAQPITFNALTMMADHWSRSAMVSAGGLAAAGIADMREYLDRLCIAVAIYHEARGEPESGQRAVAVTILNRMHSSAYPGTACGVVYQGFQRPYRCQFSFACDQRPDLPANGATFSASLHLSGMVAAGSPDDFFPCFKIATHYHRHDVNPVWSRKLRLIGQIGDHVFFASDRVLRRMESSYRRQGLENQCKALLQIASVEGLVP